MTRRRQAVLRGPGLPLLAALGLWAAVPTIASRPAQPGTLTRNLVRPVVMPFLWRGAARALRDGRIGETVERGRTLMRMLPEWGEGYILFAQLLAFDASQRAPDVETALDRLLAGTLLLREAARIRPDLAADFLLSEAFFLEIRCRQQPKLRDAFEARTGQDPLQAAANCLAEAARVSPRLDIRVRQAYLAERMIGPALAAGDTKRAKIALELAVRLLKAAERGLRRDGNVAGADTAAGHVESLGRLARYLDGDPEITRKQLRADPLLDAVMRNW